MDFHNESFTFASWSLLIWKSKFDWGSDPYSRIETFSTSSSCSVNHDGYSIRQSFPFFDSAVERISRLLRQRFEGSKCVIFSNDEDIVTLNVMK